MASDFKTRFFPSTNEVDVWHCHHQQRTGRISAALAWGDHRLMASLDLAERRRVARLAARRGHRGAASWWAANAASAADRLEARRAVSGYIGGAGCKP